MTLQTAVQSPVFWVFFHKIISNIVSDERSVCDDAKFALSLGEFLHDMACSKEAKQIYEAALEMISSFQPTSDSKLYELQIASLTINMKLR